MFRVPHFVGFLFCARWFCDSSVDALLPPYNVNDHNCGIDSFYDQRVDECLPFGGGGRPISIDPHIKCPNDADDIIPYPGMDKFYFYCHNDSVVIGECQDNKIFDTKIKKCNYKMKLPCNVQEMPECKQPGQFGLGEDIPCFYKCDEKLVPSIYQCADSTTYSPQLNRCAYTPTQVVNGDSLFTEDDEFPMCLMPGRFRSRSHCGKYYMCSAKTNGRFYQVRYKCPAGWWFNVMTEKCEDKQVECIPLTILETNLRDRPRSEIKCKSVVIEDEKRDDTPKCSQSNSPNCESRQGESGENPADEPMLGASNPSDEPILGAPNPQQNDDTTTLGNQEEVEQVNNSENGTNAVQQTGTNDDGTQVQPATVPGRVEANSTETQSPAQPSSSGSPNNTTTVNETPTNDTDVLASNTTTSNNNPETNSAPSNVNNTETGKIADSVQNTTKPIENSPVNGTEKITPVDQSLNNTITTAPSKNEPNETHTIPSDDEKPKETQNATGQHSNNGTTTGETQNHVEPQSNTTAPNGNGTGSPPSNIQSDGKNNSTGASAPVVAQSPLVQNVTTADNSSAEHGKNNGTSSASSSTNANGTHPAEPNNGTVTTGPTQAAAIPATSNNSTLETVVPRPPLSSDPPNVTAESSNATLPIPSANQIKSSNASSNESVVLPPQVASEIESNATKAINQSAINQPTQSAETINATQTNDSSIALTPPAANEPSRDNSSIANASDQPIANQTSTTNAIAAQNVTNVNNIYFAASMTTGEDGKEHYNMALKQPIKLVIDYAPDCGSVKC